MRTKKELARMLLRDDIISSEEVEIVEYGLENLGSNLLGMLITMAIGYFFSFLPGSVLLWLMIFLLRKNAGGYHASTRGRCMLFSTAVLLVSFVIFVRLSFPEIIYVMTAVFSFAIILFMAPVENENKHLDQMEHRVYRKRTMLILVLEGTLYVMAFFFHWKGLIIVLTMDFFIVAVTLLVGKLKLLRKNETS